MKNLNYIINYIYLFIYVKYFFMYNTYSVDNKKLQILINTYSKSGYWLVAYSKHIWYSNYVYTYIMYTVSLAGHTELSNTVS